MSNAESMTSPYRGLTPYTEEDAAYFFGRTSEIANITTNLEVARLTLLYGPSGVGKTSVLRAGVIHRLQEQAQNNQRYYGQPEVIPIYFNRWHQRPLDRLYESTVEALQRFRGNENLPTLSTEATDLWVIK